MKAKLTSLLTLACLLLVSSCTEKRSEPVVTTTLFEVPVELSHQSHVMLRADVDNDGVEDAVIVVRDTTVRTNRRDSVHLFLWSAGEKHFKQECVFAVEDFESAQLADLQRSGKKEFVMFSNGGGSSPTASRGLELYQYKAPCFVKVLSVDNGNPLVYQVDSSSVIVKSEVYSSFFSRSESVDYADSVLCPFTVDPAAAKLLRQHFFENYSARQQQVMDSVFHHATRKQLLHRASFEAAVRRIMALKKIGRADDARTTAAQLQQRIPSLPTEYKEALKDILEGTL